MTTGHAAAIVTIAADGPDLDPAVHGTKACGLQQLQRLGLPVPPAVVVPVETAAAIAEAVKAGKEVKFFPELGAEVDRLGSTRLAVRSGAAVSLPGAFDTVLDVEPAAVPEAIATVVESTHTKRAETIARAMGVDHVPPTAVIVQHQIDTTGNDTSGAGAVTSRDPVTGAPGLHGSMAWTTRGDAVMSGRVAVEAIDALRRCPDVLRALTADVARLDAELDTGVEVEFAVESGRLWYLQLRRMVLAETAPEPAAPDQRQRRGRLLARGRPASPGVGRGELHVDVDDALDAIEAGRAVVIALETTSPGEVGVMTKAAGVLTVLGSPESHAAVVTRSAGVPAVVSVQSMRIGDDGVELGELHLDIGRLVTVDGTRGHVLVDES